MENKISTGEISMDGVEFKLDFVIATFNMMMEALSSDIACGMDEQVKGVLMLRRVESTYEPVLNGIMLTLSELLEGVRGAASTAT